MVRRWGRGLGRVAGEIRTAIRERPLVFAGVALAVFALNLVLPVLILTVARKPWDHFSFNPWLSQLPGWLASSTVTLGRKLEFLSHVALFWFIASGQYDDAEWGFSADVRDLGRWLLIGVLFGAYFVLWLHARRRLAAGGGAWRGSGTGGFAGAFLSTLGLSTAPCSVAGCGLPVLPVMGLALQGLTSGTLAAMAGVSKIATWVVIGGTSLAIVALASITSRARVSEAGDPGRAAVRGGAQAGGGTPAGRAEGGRPAPADGG